jgi:integrase
MDRKNLKLRNLSWYVRLKVPQPLRDTVGKSELLRALHTRDLREANRRKHAVLAEMQDELSRAAAQATLPRDSAEYLLATAKELRAAVKKGETNEHDAEIALDVALEDHLERHSRKRGRNPKTGDPLLPEAHERTLSLAHRVLHSEDVALLSQSITDYLAEKAPHINEQTKREKERQLTELKEWLKGDCEVASVTKKLAGRYVGEVLLKKGHAPKTVKDTLSNLSAFWRWLEGRGLVEFNVWQGMSSTVRGSTRGTKPKRRPWTNEELLKLLEGIPTSDPLWPMAVIAAYTGMRREEVARLRVEDVAEDAALIVREGKSAAAVRRVPVHPALRPLIARLKDMSKDTYLIPGLLTGGFDDKRAHYVGKRFSELKKTLGFTDSALKFHTLRNAFMQRCEEGEVPESTTKLIVGHSRQADITYGLYSPGVKFDALTKAVAKVTYGDVDALVKRLAKTVEVTKKSTRRPRAAHERRQRKAA